MIQDIAPHIYHNEYHESQPLPEDPVLVYDGSKTLLHMEEDRHITFPTAGMLEKEKLVYTYLFSIDETHFYLGNTKRFARVPEAPVGYSYETTRVFRTARPKELAFAGITGHSLYEWYSENRYCGRCGSPMVKDQRERMIKCPSCGTIHYPKISPAVIVGVRNGDRILMSRYAGRSFKSYALLAGFNEIGETIEETVHREVMEEVGLRVKNLRFYKSQPWPFSNSLLMGFFCDVDGDDTIRVDHDELSEAAWHTADEVPEDAEHISLTSEMMTLFKRKMLGTED